MIKINIFVIELNTYLFLFLKYVVIPISYIMDKYFYWIHIFI